jgi:shikimate kinase
MKHHVALVGFMASGKSTIGRKLSHVLGCTFFDTDDLVAWRHGPVSGIFEKEGEAAFRRYECEAISGALDHPQSSVIALGGGALTLAANRKLLEDRAYQVFIRVAPERILQRVRRSREVRPLLGAAPTLAQITELYDRRMPYYASADHVVKADGLSDAQVIREIVEWLREAKIPLVQTVE